MRVYRAASAFIRNLAIVLVLILCLGMASFAYADGVMPKMPAPPTTPVYWQLVSIEQEVSATPSSRYSVHYTPHALSLDLEDRLLTASQLSEDDAAQGITLTILKDDEIVMEHCYLWTPMPIYIEPGKSYPIHITGTQQVGKGYTPNSLLGVYALGTGVGERISAGNYTKHTPSTSFEVSTDTGIYKDGSIVFSFVLSDVNDMFRDRIVFRYEMQNGIKPEPTPIPGFVAVDTDDTTEIPAFYVPVEGHDGLWSILTAPGQYRAYGSMSGSAPMFFPADADGNVVMNERPVTATHDFDTYVKGFVAESPDGLPSFYKVGDHAIFTLTTRDGEEIARVHGRVDGGEPAFYPADAQGNVAPEAEPVDPQADYDTYVRGFGLAPYTDEIPAHYQPVEGTEGLFTFTGRDGVQRYRAYGRLNGNAPALYPSDAQGNVVESASPTAPLDDFEAYIKGFDAVQPDAAAVPAYYDHIEGSLYAIADREGSTLYRVYGIKDGAAPAFYPADAEGSLLTEDVSAVEPDADFIAYVEGFEPMELPEPHEYYEKTEVPGVWAFIDKDGNAQYRAFGSLDREDPAFYPSDAAGNVLPGAHAVQIGADLALMPPPVFVPMTPPELPPHYEIVQQEPEIYGFTGFDGTQGLRVYGAFERGPEGFHPADESGEPLSKVPVDPQADFEDAFGGFTASVPQTIPSHYEAVEDIPGLYRYTDGKGTVHYRVHGAADAADDTPAAFYPADARGSVISGLTADPDAELAMMQEGFTPAEPETVPPHYIPVPERPGHYRYLDEQGNEQHRVYGAADGQEPGFYPANAQGERLTGDSADPGSEYGAIYGGFVPTAPSVSEIPDFYVPVEGQEGVYAYTDEAGDVHYRVYGSKDGEAESAFYPASADGQVNAQQAADPDTEYDRLYAAFTPASPVTVPSRYAQVEDQENLYAFTDDAGEEAYRVYGDLGGESGFYPADAQGNILSGAPVNPQADVRRMPMVITHTISTPVPAPTVDTTPLARVKPADTGWIDLNAPQPTQYAATISPAQTADAAQQTVGKTITPAPEATGYVATVTGPEDAATDGPSISSLITAGPEPTAYDATITGPEAADGGNAVVSSEITAGPEPTAYDATVVTPDATEGANPTVTSELTMPPEITVAPTPEPEPEAEKAPSIWLIVAIAAVVIVAAIIVIVLVRNRKRPD